METIKLPLMERLRQVRNDESGGTPLRKESLACFCEGVSLLAKTAYPKWLQQQIEQFYSAPVNTPFLGMVNHAQYLIDREKEASFQGCYGYELMYQLLIEPFYLINEADKEESSK